jgi:DtxR family Mn-dependent transcriptional regulator
MERDGLLHVSTADRHLELTDEGRAKATRVMRKHRLAERLLLDVIGLEWHYVHEEACRWEHVMSDRVERKLLTLLVDPRESPYGNPIPGLDELGGVGGLDFRDGVRPLTEVLSAEVGEVVVRRIGEPLQSDAATLELLGRVGLRPGRRVAVRSDGTAVRVLLDGEEAQISLTDAQHVFVDRIA